MKILCKKCMHWQNNQCLKEVKFDSCIVETGFHFRCFHFRGKSFTGFPKPNFRQLMLNFWMAEGHFDSEADALKNYNGNDFDALCKRCDGTTLLTFTHDDRSTCFESVDNNYVIPLTAIDIYTGEL